MGLGLRRFEDDKQKSHASSLAGVASLRHEAERIYRLRIVSVALFFTPLYDATILAVTFLLVLVVATLNVAVLAPPGTVTVAGTVARAGLLLVSVTSNPAAGAAPLRRTVPSELDPPTSVDGFNVTLDNVAGGAGFTVMVVDLFTPP